jgi:hypothetical protein
MHSKNSKKHKNKFTTELIGEFGKPTFTKEDMIIENRIHDKMEELGIKVPDTLGNISEEDIRTDDELEALHYICRQQEVPEELQQRLKSRKYVRKEVKHYDVTIPREEALRMMNEFSKKKR